MPIIVWKGTAMNNKTLAAALFASLSAIILPVNAMDINPVAQEIIDTALINKCNFDIVTTQDSDIKTTDSCDFNQVLITAITNNPDLADSLVAAAIAAVGPNTEAAESIIASAIIALGIDSPLITNILTAATEAGVNSDTVTVIAIANGVDATIASEATAAGDNTGNTTNTGNGNSGNNSGGGGGGGGISTNQ